MSDEYVADQEEVENGDDLGGGYPRLRRRYEHYKVGYQRYKRVYMRSLVAAVSLGIVCVGLTALLVSAWMTRTRIETENIALLRQLGSLEVRLANAESRLKASGPVDLTAFKFDTLFPVPDSYVKAIELSQPDSMSGAIRFQLLLENTRTNDLAPEVSLELFDGSGSSVRTHKLDLQSAGLMRPGSTRSVSGSFTESAYTRVAFFRVKTN